MGQVQRGVVRGSNKEGPGGDGRMNGFLPLGSGAPSVYPTNMPGASGDRRNGSFPLDGGASPMTPPNAKRFDVGMVQMPQPESAIEPGLGVVPVNPFLPGGSAAVIGYRVPEKAPKGGK
jgi:hypothetical protein